MRNRILAGLGVAALATVGLAAPANAISDTSADLYVVHAFPGLTAFGPMEDETFSAVIFTIDGLGATPAEIPAGEAGLGQQSNGGLIAVGAALMLALAGAAVVVRRQTVGAER